MARKGDKRRNRKQRDARHQAQKLDVNPETIDPLKTETVDPLKTETIDPLKTLLAPFNDDIEKIKLEMMKRGYEVMRLSLRVLKPVDSGIKTWRYCRSCAG